MKAARKSAKAPALAKSNGASKPDVYLRIKSDIIGNKFEQGSWLQEDSLAARYRVSRTPIREALSRLKSEGLLEILPRRGAFVVKLSFKKMMEVYDVSEALEDLAIAYAVSRASDDQLRELSAVVEPENSPSKEDISGLMDRVTLFHHMLADLSGNETLSHLLKNVYNKLDMCRTKVIRLGDRRFRTLEEHYVVAEAMLKRDTRLAQQRNRERVDRIRKDIQDNIHLFD
jgi:DNA-binding GntR family transcriptional regulator